MALLVEHKKPGYAGNADGVAWRNGKARVPKLLAQTLVKDGHFCEALGKPRPAEPAEKPKKAAKKK